MTMMQLNAEMLRNTPTDFSREEFLARIEKARTQPICIFALNRIQYNQ
jgi:hypothetical protein